MKNGIIRRMTALLLMMAETPLFSLCITRIRSSFSANVSQIFPDLSLFPSSISKSSKFVYSCPRMLSIHLLIVFSALYTGTMMLTIGFIGLALSIKV